MILSAKLPQRHRCREKMYAYQGGKGIECEELGDWDGYIYIYIHIYIYILLILRIKYTTNENLLCSSGNST